MYESRLRERRELARREARRAATISNARLGVFLLGAGVAFAVFGPTGLQLAWLAPPALAFAVLVVVHDRVLRARKRADEFSAQFDKAYGGKVSAAIAAQCPGK